MFQVPLTATPNQTFAFSQDGAYWQIKVYQAKVYMCADITRNGEVVIEGVRCFGGIPLMPYEYMWKPSFGNFVFDSDADWTNFGSSCNLYYMSETELDEFDALILSTSTS